MAVVSRHGAGAATGHVLRKVGESWRNRWFVQLVNQLVPAICIRTINILFLLDDVTRRPLDCQGRVD